MVLGKLDIHMQKYETGGLSYTTHKENWNRLKTKTWSYKNPEKNKWKNILTSVLAVIYWIWHWKLKQQKHK